MPRKPKKERHFCPPEKKKIAIVGIGCRFPGDINDVKDFWEVLHDGRDCTIPMPEDRFDVSYFYHPTPKTPGKFYVRGGGYLDRDLLSFDRLFFKMPPDEANHMDPKFRMLLEVVWEAFEDGGIPAGSMRGSNCGVYIGTTVDEYSSLCGYDIDNISQYSNSGTNNCMASNRISYEFDLRGPSFSIDTACSSSLYAVHLAAEAIRNGDCAMAVAGGVNLIMMTESTIGFCQAGMMAPDGKSKSFDVSADGYCRSEGAGAVILKPLDQAVKDGDRIYAVIRGGALSNDGRTPGIANPSYSAQVELVDRACHHANIKPRDIQYVEAHGTGTQVGDATEANAIGEAIGLMKDASTPLYIGSVKSNIGHCEGASGIAGVIKLALMMYHGTIPPVVHFKSGNPNIPFKELNIKVPKDLITWPYEKDLPLIAGCSSFGFGGANAHIILEGAPTMEGGMQPVAGVNSNPQVVLISAATATALSVRLDNYIKFFNEMQAQGAERFYDVAATTCLRSHHHQHRLAVIGRDVKEVVSALETFKTEGSASGVVSGEASDSNTKMPLVFVFNGMGTQWSGMGRQLLQQEPTFAKTIQKFDVCLKKCGAKWSVRWLLLSNRDKNLINQTEYTQPVICAVHIGLVEVLRNHGVQADAVVGHSVGEVAAAYASGMLSFENAVMIIYNRGKLLNRTSGSGKMLAVLHESDAAQEKARENQRKHSAQIDVAAINSPSQVVFSGASSSIDSLADMFQQEGIRAITLNVNNAFHSHQQEPLRESFLKKMKPLEKEAGVGDGMQVPMISTVTNSYNSPTDVNSGMYWWKNIRQQVKFQSAIETLLGEGYSTFLEIGAHPALRGPLRDIISLKGRKAKVLETLKRPPSTVTGSDDLKTLSGTLALLHCDGYPVSYEAMFPSPYKVMHLPLYPWERLYCSAITEGSRGQHLFPVHNHHLLGEMHEDIVLGSGETPSKFQWRGKISKICTPWVSHHAIQGSVILPATGFIETFLAAVSAVQQERKPITLIDVNATRLLFPTDGEAVIHTILQDDKITIYSGDQGKYIEHANCKVVGLKADKNPAKDEISMIQELTIPIQELQHLEDSLDVHFDYEKFHSFAALLGLEVDSAFKGVQQASFDQNFTKCIARAEAPYEIWKEFGMYKFHPAFLDCMMQTYGLMHFIRKKYAAFPSSVRRLTFYGKQIPRRIVVYVQLFSNTGEDQNELLVIDAESGAVCCKLENVSFRSLEGEQSSNPLKLWDISWVETELPEQTYVKEEASPTYYITSNNRRDLDVLQNALKQQHENVRVLDLQEERKPRTEDIVLILISQDGSYISSSYTTGDEDIRRVIKSTSSFAKETILDLVQLEDASPKMWIITVKGFQLSVKDEVSPFAASSFAVGLTTVHEYPDARVYMLDISGINDICTHGTQITSLLCFPVFGENEFALRSNASGEPSLFVRRLKCQSPMSIRHPVDGHQFELQVGGLTKQIEFVLEKEGIMAENNSGNCVYISVEHFLADTFLGDGLRFICTGNIIKNSGNTDEFDEGLIVMAVSRGRMGSTISVPSENVIPIGHMKTPPAALLSLVKDALASSTLVHCSKSILRDDRVLLCTCEESRQGLITAHFLKNFGCDVAILGFPCNNDCPDHEKLPQGQKIGEYVNIEQMLQEDGVSSAGKFQVVIATGQYVMGTKGFLQCMDSICKFGTLVVFTSAPSKMKTFSDFENIQLLPVRAGIQNLVETPQQLAHILQFAEDNMPTEPSLLATAGQALPASKIVNKTLDETVGRVIHFDRPGMGVVSSFLEDTFQANPEMTQCVTGGAKGLGLEIVKWLVRRGSNNIVILTRSNPTEENQRVIDQLSKDANIVLHICDISNAERMDSVFSEVVETQPLVESIFHCATVYRDSLMANMSEGDWEMVMLPKAYGGVLLHQMSLKYKLPLKNFVMISSLVAIVGNAGQANYGAANSVLLSIVEMRRAMGLPATAASLGVISEAGFAAEHNLVSVWEAKGLESISPSQIMRALGTMLQLDYSHLGISGLFDEVEYARRQRSIITKGDIEGRVVISRFQGLFTNKGLQELSGKTAKPQRTESDIKVKLEKYISQILGVTSINAETSPVDMGLDSLMATDLRLFIDEEFNVSLPPVDLLKSSTTMAQLVSMINTRMHSTADSTPIQINEVQGHSAKGKNSLFVAENFIKEPRFQVFCFPGAGLGLTSFTGWQKYFSKFHTQVYVAQIPGWEGRHLEDSTADMSELLGLLASEISPLLMHGKFAFYGHSFGGLVAYELAHLLNEQGVLPLQLFVGAWFAPQIPYKERPVKSTIPDNIQQNSDFSNEAQQLTILDARITKNHNSLRNFAPVLRSVREMYKNYRFSHLTPLPCPLKIYAGKNDKFVPRDKLNAWEDIRDKNYSFGIKVFKGGHLFLHDTHARTQLTQDIAKALHLA